MGTVKIINNTQQVINDIDQKSNIFLRQMGNKIVKLSQPNTPKKTGRLRMDTFIQVLGLKGKIVWTKDYAAKMETKQFRNYTTPGTGPHYAEDAVREGIADTLSIAKASGLI